MYGSCPGMKDVGMDDYIILMQAAIYHNKKAEEILKKVPCLYMIKSMKGKVYIALQMDDNLMMRNPKAIDEVMEQLEKKELMLEVSGSLEGYLFCEIWFLEDKRNYSQDSPL